MAEPSAGWRSQHNILAITEALKKSELGGARYGIDGIPRHLRRRTRSHNPYKHRRRPNANKKTLYPHLMMPPKISEATDTTSYPTCTNRKMRRRPGILAADYLSKAVWPQSFIEEKDQEIRYFFVYDDNTPPRSPPPPRRLETHLWHAKRLAMVPTWNGWVLPEGEPGPGRGTRAFAHRISTGAVLHDASYWCPVIISGRLEAVVTCLKQVIDPEIVKLVQQKLEKGSTPKIGWELEAMLHKINDFPLHALTPVKITALPHAGPDGKEENFVKLCVWIHGAAVGEAHNTLKAAVERTIQSIESGGSSIENEEKKPSLSLLVGNARRIEIKGAKSDHVLLNALFKQSQTNREASTPRLPHNLRILKPGQAALIAIPDPRLSKPITLGSSTSTSLLTIDSFNKVDYDIFNQNYPPPLTETAVSLARKEARDRMVVGEELQPTTEKEIKDEGTDLPSSSLNCLENPTHCAAIFIRGQKSLKSTTGWSIILPPGWVMPMWLALVFQGCQPTGQREWRWLHTLDHLPFFPNDMPDAPAYDRYIGKQEEIGRSRDVKRPFGKSNFIYGGGLSWLYTSELNTLDGKRKGALDNRTLGEDDEVEKFVARSESAMLKALFGASSSLQKSRNSSLRPVAKALADGKLHWVPRNMSNPDLLTSSVTLGGNLCLVETTVTMVNQGAPEDRANIYVIWKEEGELSQGETCYLNQIQAEEANKRHINHSQVIPIGYITSAAPQATGRGSVSMALVTAAAFWRLRSVQYNEYKRDKGTVEAWMRNPTSTILYPVRLSLLLEERN